MLLNKLMGELYKKPQDTEMQCQSTMESFGGIGCHKNTDNANEMLVRALVVLDCMFPTKDTTIIETGMNATCCM